MFFPYATILSTSSNVLKSGQYCPQTVAAGISLLDCELSRAISILCLVIPQSLEANWRKGHYTVTRVQTGSSVRCLQCDDKKVVTGHNDSMIKVGSCMLHVCSESVRT